MRLFITVFILVMLPACRHSLPLVDAPSTSESTVVPHWPGVDSTIALVADSLADGILISPEAIEESKRHIQKALFLKQLADSLLGTLPELPDSVSSSQQIEASRAFNEGANLLIEYADLPDSTRANHMLSEATEHFVTALDINPYDEEALYWLARVHLLQPDNIDEAITVSHRLVSLWGHRPAYITILASAYERMQTMEARFSAGALWLRAANLTVDDYRMDPDGRSVLDSSSVFSHYVQGGRAFVSAMQGEFALAALDSASLWVTREEERAYVASERRWILWDGGNLHTRVHFDSLLTLSSTDLEGAVAGMTMLMDSLHSEKAMAELKHERGCASVQSGAI